MYGHKWVNNNSHESNFVPRSHTFQLHMTHQDFETIKDPEDLHESVNCLSSIILSRVFKMAISGHARFLTNTDRVGFNT